MVTRLDCWPRTTLVDKNAIHHGPYWDWCLVVGLSRRGFWADGWREGRYELVLNQKNRYSGQGVRNENDISAQAREENVM